MKNINQITPELINRILGIICLEKGLSKNTKTAYTKDISLAFDWFKNNNINCFRANEKNFRELFFFLQSKYFYALEVVNSPFYKPELIPSYEGHRTFRFKFFLIV